MWVDFVFLHIRGLGNTALVQHCKIFISSEKSMGRIVESRIDVPNLQLSLLSILGTCSCREIVRGVEREKRIVSVFPMHCSL